MNVVISTTFGWNIGDQFVLAGVKTALATGRGSGIHYVHHDRNPERLPGGGSESHAAITCGWADALVIAGTPGWTLECVEIYRTALAHKTPIYLIGIGTALEQEGLLHQFNTNPVLQEMLATAALIICRDEICRDVVGQFASGVHLLPCPAALNGLYKSSQRAGEVVAMGEHYHGPYDREGLIAHSIADLEQSNGRAFYSANSAQYINIYGSVESVASSRLHASVVRRGFGLPITNLWPESDVRCSATWAVVDSMMKDGPRGLLAQYHELLKP